ncbi:MAG: hypothetical protein WCJ62_03565 [Flavobacterium sp.]
MKVFIMILVSVFIGKGCTKQVKNDIENTKIVYSANSRGLYLKITVQNQELSVVTNRREAGNGTTTKISDTDWKELVALFNKMNLEKINSYNGPTQKRFYDGAPMANMVITYKEKDYETTTFDHGAPPIEISDFVNKVTSLVKQE